MAYEDSKTFFFRLNLSILIIAVITAQKTRVSQLITSGQLKVGNTSTNSLAAVSKSRIIKLQIPQQTLSLFFLSQSPPFSNSQWHSSICSLTFSIFSSVKQMQMSLKLISIFLPISIVFLRAMVQVQIALSNCLNQSQISALLRIASLTQVSPKFYSASLILSQTSAILSSRVFSISIFKYFLNQFIKIDYRASASQIRHNLNIPNISLDYKLILQNMDKSMVHELNGLASSQFFNRSAFITTAINEGDFSLRKSRIQNLPSYKKQDLSRRLQFVIVFQTIEIERLSTQVQSLRVALKDQERQHANIHSYEIQIRELTEKCHSLEAEKQGLQDECERMNVICHKFYEQIEDMKSRYANIDPTIKQKYRLQQQRTAQLEEDLQKWRTRYRALQHSKNRQMEDMRLLMESQRKSMIDRQIKEITIKFNSQRSNLENEIRKLREMIVMKDNELERMGSRISQLQIINQEMRHYQETISEYENKFAMISQQTIRLNELLRSKQEQIEKFSNREDDYKRRLNNLERELMAEKEGGQKVREMEQVVREWQIRCSRLEDEKKKCDQELEKIPEFLSMIKQITQETERMKDALKDKMRDNDEWKYRYEKLTSEFNEAKSQQQQEIPRLQNKINQVNNENIRISEILKNRTGEMENWKNKYGDLERQIQKIPQIQKQKRDIQARLEQQIRITNEIQHKNKEMYGMLKDLDSVKGALQQQKQSKEQCLNQIDRLNGSIRDLARKNEDSERKCQNLEKQLQSYLKMEQEIQVYKKQQINLTRQIDRINGIINEKVQQIQNLKETFKKLQYSINQYQGMEQKLMNTVTQMQKLMQDLDESRKQSGFYQQKLMVAEGELKKSKNEMYVLTQEKQQAVKLFNNKSRQLENLMSESEQMRGQINVLKQKQNRGREFEEKCRIAEGKIGDLQRNINRERLRSQEANRLLEKTTEELNKIKKQGMISPEFREQFMQVKYQCEQKQRQIKNLVLRINQLENIVKRLKEVTMRNDQISKRNHQKWTSIDSQIDMAIKMVQKTIEMQNQIYRLNEENMKLQGKNRMLTVELDCENLKKSTIESTSRISSDASISGYTPKRMDNLGFGDSYNNGYSSYNVTVSRNNYRTEVPNTSIGFSTNTSFPFRQNRDKY